MKSINQKYGQQIAKMYLQVTDGQVYRGAMSSMIIDLCRFLIDHDETWENLGNIQLDQDLSRKYRMVTYRMILRGEKLKF